VNHGIGGGVERDQRRQNVSGGSLLRDDGVRAAFDDDAGMIDLAGDAPGHSRSAARTP
jgi:hypothetical protein